MIINEYKDVPQHKWLLSRSFLFIVFFYIFFARKFMSRKT